MSAPTYAVIVNWNGGEQNLDCIRSLLAQGLDQPEIMFVDNGSSDDSVARVAAEYPAVRVVRNDRNTGYGHGTNQGIELAMAAGAGYVFLVNNDLTMPAGALDALRCVLDENPDVGIVGPRIVYAREPGMIWCAGGMMTWRQNLSTMVGHRRPDGPQFQKTREVDFVAGCAMLVRRVVFARVGLLEADYFAYHEDVEFCIKAAAAGFRTLMVGEVLAHHDAHSSTGGGYNPRRKYMMGVNTVWFLRRHGTPRRWLGFFVFDVLSLPFVWLLRAPRGEGAGVRAKARGMFDAARGKRVTEEATRR